MANEIQNYGLKKEIKCPFYGFSYALGMFMDSKGNQCALITDSFSPCVMEMRKKEVNWPDCGFNKKEKASTIETILSSFTIFPDKLMPANATSWEGIPFRKWYEHVVNGKKI